MAHGLTPGVGAGCRARAARDPLAGVDRALDAEVPATLVAVPADTKEAQDERVRGEQRVLVRWERRVLVRWGQRVLVR